MGIETVLSIIVSITIIGGAVYAFLRYMIKSETQDRTAAMTRMNETLERLDKTLDKLSAIVDRLDDRQQQTAQELAIIKANMDAMHRRQDNMAEDISKFAHFYYETHNCDGHDCSAVIDIMQRSRRGE